MPTPSCLQGVTSMRVTPDSLRHDFAGNRTNALVQSTGDTCASAARVNVTPLPACNGNVVPPSPIENCASATVMLSGEISATTLFSEISNGLTTGGLGNPTVPADQPAPSKTGLAELKPWNV